MVPSQLDGQGQSRERAFQVSLYFRRAAIPAAGLGQGRGLILAAQHHDRMVLVGLGVAHVTANDVIQHLGEKLVLQVLGVEGHARDREMTPVSSSLTTNSAVD